MNKKLNLFITELGEARVKFDESLHYHTVSNSDAVAEILYLATNQKELERVLNTALELDMPFQVLGSDISDSDKKRKKIDGLVIKNRTHLIKISGIKGKFVVGSMGIDQVLLEVDSGVTLKDLQDYFVKNKLVQPLFASNEKLTFGESLVHEFGIQGLLENIRVWEKGVIEEISILEFQPKKQIVLSAVIRAKSIQIV
jgi:hypothetical protein